MAEKLKASNSRAKTLSSKLKAAEAEAADVDELIFRKDFQFPAYILQAFILNPETDRMILCIYQRVWDLNGRKMMDSPGPKPMKKPEIPLATLLTLAGALHGSCP